ncbi:MAG TPA: hypothetical protein VG013_06410 [Gemmataceae bacterium]|jgi:hypothetical protein|nr:hypothetical protein [Gemmataceae bacterium]
MPAYDKARIKGFLNTLDTSTNQAVRGKAFEELACYLFSCVPGITITGRNEMNTFATEEIDVACRNEQDAAGLRLLNPFFLVECKGWKDPIHSEQVAWFLMKIEHRGLDFGVLIAANGITGVPEHLTAANFLVSFALATKKIRMVIITRAEIEALNSGEELAQKIIDKLTLLHATGGKCY